MKRGEVYAVNNVENNDKKWADLPVSDADMR